MNIKLRYKLPEADASKLITYPVNNSTMTLENTSQNFRFAAAVAEFGLLLRQSSFKQKSNYEQVIKIANSSMGKDKNGYRSSFVNLVKESMALPQDLGMRE